MASRMEPSGRPALLTCATFVGIWSAIFCLNGGRLWELYCKVLHHLTRISCLINQLERNSDCKKNLCLNLCCGIALEHRLRWQEEVCGDVPLLARYRARDEHLEMFSLETEEEPLEQKICVVSLPRGTRSLRE